MKVGLKGMLATSVATAAIFAGAHVAQADGMPSRPAPAYAAPENWSGIYLGFESGWDWDNTDDRFVKTGTHSHWDRDAINIGVYLGYQHQFGNFVLGAEFNFIGNEFDQEDRVFPTHGVGNCPAAVVNSFTPVPLQGLNCVGRITDIITIGPRLGYAVGKFMPYVTGGWASGSVNFRTITQGTPGVPPSANPPVSFTATTSTADDRLDGFYIGGGLDWKIAQNAVVGIEYRHTDLGSATIATINSAGSPTFVPLIIRQNAESDAILLRGHLLFGREVVEAPLK
jgi:outer membrane immunogenic protein